jgi:transcriptional regulator with XRE-family HTH domain
VELSQKLKELRKKQGLTQLELAERLFVSRQAISGWEAGTSRPSTENLQSLCRLFNIPLETLLDDTAEAEPAAAPEKLPAEEQAKEEGKGQGLGKDRRYKAIVMVIVLLAILLTTAVLAHRRTAQEKTGVMTFSEMECEDIDLAGAKSVPIEGFGEGKEMRRLLCMVLTGAVMIGCLCTGTGAVDESNVVSKEYETTGTAITRATGNLDWTIKANGTVVADTSFTMSAGETVRIRANYSPENASLDFGLVDSNEKFHYINVTTGSIDKTIEIPENGDYTLAIRNNSSKSVKVTGDVRY